MHSLGSSCPLLGLTHFATCADGRPHVAPVWYVYDDGVLEVVTSGRKLANVRANPRVAVSVQEDVEGDAQWMVSLLGTASVVEDEVAFRTANRRINEKYGADEGAYGENTFVSVEIGSVSSRTY